MIVSKCEREVISKEKNFNTEKVKPEVNTLCNSVSPLLCVEKYFETVPYNFFNDRIHPRSQSHISHTV